jgi:hypothetical protein
MVNTGRGGCDPAWVDYFRNEGGFPFRSSIVTAPPASKQPPRVPSATSATTEATTLRCGFLIGQRLAPIGPTAATRTGSRRRPPGRPDRRCRSWAIFCCSYRVNRNSWQRALKVLDETPRGVWSERVGRTSRVTCVFPVPLPRMACAKRAMSENRVCRSASHRTLWGPCHARDAVRQNSLSVFGVV